MAGRGYYVWLLGVIMFSLALWGGVFVDSILFWIFSIMALPFAAIGWAAMLDKERAEEEPVPTLEPVCPFCGYKNPYYARICARCGRHPGEIVPEEAAPEGVKSERTMPASLFDVLCFYCGHENPRDAKFCIKCGRYLGETYP